MDDVPVVKSEYIGEQEVIGMQTGTKTFIAEGFASHNTEYGSQRPSCEYWLGIAAGKGIKIYTAEPSDLLLTTFLYGFEEQAQDRFLAKLKNRRDEVQAKIQNISNQRSQADAALNQHIGARTDLEHMIKLWGKSN
jgi:hypothetical protein